MIVNFAKTMKTAMSIPSMHIRRIFEFPISMDSLIWEVICNAKSLFALSGCDMAPREEPFVLGQPPIPRHLTRHAYS